MTAGFDEPLAPELAAILGDARAPRSRPEEAETALRRLLDEAPDSLEVRIAAYSFYFYTTRLQEALPHAEACLTLAATALGISGDWRALPADDARFAALDRPQRVFLQSLVAIGYCRARLGELAEASAALSTAARLDPTNRFGARRLADLVARGGPAPDEDDEPGEEEEYPADRFPRTP